MEPISPELVLVDPELARFARAHLPAHPHAHAAVAGRLPGERVAPIPLPERTGTRRTSARAKRVITPLLATCLLFSLFAAGTVSGMGVGDLATSVAHQTPQADSIVGPNAGDALVTAPQHERVASPPRRSAKARAPIVGRVAVERRILQLLQEAPREEIPPALIARETGLLRTNVRVRCRRSNAVAFRCSVSRAGARQPLLEVGYDASTSIHVVSYARRDGR